MPSSTGQGSFEFPAPFYTYQEQAFDERSITSIRGSRGYSNGGSPHGAGRASRPVALRRRPSSSRQGFVRSSSRIVTPAIPPTRNLRAASVWTIATAYLQAGTLEPP